MAGLTPWQQTVWTDLFAMLEDIRKHVQDWGRVYAYDDPVNRTLYFRSAERLWEISLAAVSVARPSNHWEDFLFKQFRTQEGRERLLRIFEWGRPRKTIWQHLKEV